MLCVASKRFLKEFAKLPKATKRKAVAALELFTHDSTSSTLRNHALAGKWKNHFSIDITGDTRAIYVKVESNVAYFVTIGSHSELYG